MKTAGAGEEIVLSGPPGKASALVRLAPGDRVVPITMKLADGPAIHRAYVRPFGENASEIRLRLPRGTPAGTYRGLAVLDGAEREVVVVVEAVPRISIAPRRSSFTTRAGARVEFDLDVANDGNVAIDVPKAASFDLDTTEGHDRALGRALRATLPPGERRVDRFFEEMRESHGGLAHVTVVAGAGPIEPGASRELKCVLDIPAAVKVGHSYLGAWQIANAGHVVVIDVVNGARNGQGGKAQ